MDDSYLKENNKFFALFIIINIIINILIIYNGNYKSEYTYINAVKKTWNNYPILNISLTKEINYEKIILLNLEGKNICDCSHIEDYKLIFQDNCNKFKLSKGCIDYISNKASKLFGIELYAQYYKADYLTLFSRLSKDGHLCKIGYKRCGYLDDNNNSLCVKEEEDCPINYIHFDFNENKTSIIKITTDNKRKDLPIINTLLISDIKNATIFDINLIDIYRKYENINNPYNREGKYKLLFVNEDFPEIDKASFFNDNKLINGDLNSLKNDSPLYLYSLVYPSNNLNIPLNMLYINLFNYIIFIQILFLIIRLYSLYLLSVFKVGRAYIKDILMFIFILLLIIDFLLIKLRISFFQLLSSQDITVIEINSFLLDFIIIIFYLFAIIGKKNEINNYKEKNN